jgi:hypothetical protein
MSVEAIGRTKAPGTGLPSTWSDRPTSILPAMGAARQHPRLQNARCSPSENRGDNAPASRRGTPVHERPRVADLARDPRLVNIRRVRTCTIRLLASRPCGMESEPTPICRSVAWFAPGWSVPMKSKAPSRMRAPNAARNALAAAPERHRRACREDRRALMRWRRANSRHTRAERGSVRSRQ